LLSQKSEHERENDGMHKGRRWARLSGHVNTFRTWWQSEQDAWAQHQEQSGGDDEVGLSEHKTHRLCDQRIRKEKYKCVEKHSSATSKAVAEGNAATVSAKQYTWAEREE
jgi:hypothetical protein